MNVIDMQTVSWRRDDRWILQNIDWTVRRGEHWALIGSNGAGKTALLNIINGYAWPTSGNVSVLGEKVWSLRRARAAQIDRVGELRSL